MDSYQWLGSNSGLPDKLNFYATFNTTIDGLVYDLYLGQGHYGTTNNWWIGSMNLWAFQQATVGPISFVDICLLMQKKNKHSLLPEMTVVNPQKADVINLSKVHMKSK